jgi:hypothetical protein
MITALIRSDGALDALALTMAALVPGVAEGVLADAVVVMSEPREEVSFVAEAVGAKVVVASGSGAWSAAAKVARREWLLCLEAGDVPAAGWIGALERFIAVRGDRKAVGRLRRPSGMIELAASAAEALAGTRRVRPGDLVARSLLSGDGFARRERPLRIGARIERPAGR